MRRSEAPNKLDCSTSSTTILSISSISSIDSFISTSFVSSSTIYIPTDAIQVASDTFQPSSTVHTVSFPFISTAAPLHPEAASVHLCTDKWLSVIQAMRVSTACQLPVLDLNELEQHIKHGITLPLTVEPDNIQFNNTTTVADNHLSVADRIEEYISIGAVQQLPVSASAPLIVQPLHVILKDGKKPRLVIDLSRNLNELLPHTAFKYASVHDAVLLSTHHCFYSKLDISNCFLSFPLHPNCYKYFTFQFDGHYYQFTRLPFGLSTAPRVCTLLLSVIQFVLEQHNLILVRYLDDFLFISSSRQLARQHLATAIQVFQDFGLVVNKSKTEGPAQQLQFLGIQLDSVARTLSVSEQRIEEMSTLLLRYISTPASEALLVKDIMSFIGKLSFVSQVLPSARPFMRRLLDGIKGKRKQSRCRVPTAFKLDCVIWLQRIRHWNGLISWSIHTQQPFVIVSDASISGFGFYLASYPSNVNLSQLPAALLPGAGVSGEWHASMSHLLTHRSIAYLELFSVVYALTMLGSVLHHQSVLVLTDNSSNVPIINKQRTRSVGIIGLLRAMAELSATHVFMCSARHISGESNVLADFLSRPLLHKHRHVDTWLLYESSNSLPLTHVTVVCSDSLYLPNPLPDPITSPLHALNVQLNYLPSLISSPRCRSVQAPSVPMHRISEPSTRSVVSSSMTH